MQANHALGAVYVGRGRSPDRYNEHLDTMSLVRTPKKQHFIRNTHGIEASAFHYTIHRKLVRFLGLDPLYGSNTEDGDEKDPHQTYIADLDSDFIDIWKHMMRSDDYQNPNTEEYDPRNMYGVSNQDVFRWPGLESGLERQVS